MFRTRIRELREAMGYKSQQAFANAFGVAQSTVGNWEAGKREPSYKTTIELANFFDCSTDYLLGYSDFPNAALSGLSDSQMSGGIVSAFKSSKLSIDEIKSACEKRNIMLSVDKLKSILDGSVYPSSIIFLNLCDILGVSDYYRIFGLIPVDLQSDHASDPNCRQILDTIESLYPADEDIMPDDEERDLILRYRQATAKERQDVLYILREYAATPAESGASAG